MLNDSAEEKHKRKSLYRFLNYVRTTRGTLFFVGDLFDFYFEYPDVVPKAYFDFYNKDSILNVNKLYQRDFQLFNYNKI